MGSAATGFWYADALLIKMYWAARPANRRTSRWTSSSVKAMKSTATSNRSSPSAAFTAASSWMSAVSTRAPRGARAALVPRLSSVSSQPRASARAPTAVLMTPVPPMNNAFMGRPPFL